MVRSSRFPFPKDILEDFLRRDAKGYELECTAHHLSTDLPWPHPNGFCGRLVPHEDRQMKD